MGVEPYEPVPQSPLVLEADRGAYPRGRPGLLRTLGAGPRLPSSPQRETRTRRGGVGLLGPGENTHVPSQLTWVCAQTPVERLLSSWKGPFCTSMLVGGRETHFRTSQRLTQTPSSPGDFACVSVLVLCSVCVHHCLEGDVKTTKKIHWEGDGLKGW